MFFLLNLFNEIVSFFQSLAPIKSSFSIDGTLLRRKDSDGKEVTVDLNDLQSIHIVTTDEGPFLDDVFWVLEDNNKRCLIVENQRSADIDLMRKLDRPNFDYGAVVAAMGSADNASFLVWQAAPPVNLGEASGLAGA